MMSRSLLIRNAQLYQHGEPPADTLLDLRCGDGTITAIAKDLPAISGEQVIDAAGGALLPGLHDHHIHLFSLAARAHSLHCGPPSIGNAEQLQNLLQRAPGSGWIRGMAYHESVAGHLNRDQLDRWVKHRPLRIQHRSGKMWFLNSAATELLALEQHGHLPGVECDQQGRANGRLFRMDSWLRAQLAHNSELDISAISNMLAGFGVTGITDATVTNNAATQQLYAELISSGQLLQQVLLMGDLSLVASSLPRLQRGAVKILLDDAALPDFEQLKEKINAAHDQQRPVAIHCVTTVELVFALSALSDAVGGFGDRIEHGSVTDSATLAMLAGSDITVVTQPNFIAERGDQYAKDFAIADYDSLYRGKGFLDAGIALAGSTDAPFGNPDPWLAMMAGVNRCSANGTVLGAGERLSPEQALKMFATTAANPGGPMRKIEPGAEANLCLLDRPWHKARLRLRSDDVVLTIAAGKIIYQK